MPAHPPPAARTSRLLLVDPDVLARRAAASCLRDAGHQVDEHPHADALAGALHGAYALVMMDPAARSAAGPRHGQDAWQRLRQLREQQRQLPVIVLQRAGGATDRCVALELGADAVLDKPTHLGELRARVRALLRRQSEGRPAARLACGDWQFDPDQRSVQRPNGESRQLSPAEARLLAQFLTRPQQALSRAELLDGARGEDAESLDRSIDLLVSRLRQKLGLRPQGPIRTVRGVGYLFDALGARELGPHARGATGLDGARC